MYKKDYCIAEYVWLDGTGINYRSKTRTLMQRPNSVEELPLWNFDGSSCYMADTENSEIYLKPVFFCNDPFRKAPHILVLCDTFYYNKDMELIPTHLSFRTKFEQIFKDGASEDPWFGIEQEYTMFHSRTMFKNQPLGWPENGCPLPQGPYYCSVGN